MNLSRFKNVDGMRLELAKLHDINSDDKRNNYYYNNGISNDNNDNNNASNNDYINNNDDKNISNINDSPTLHKLNLLKSETKVSKSYFFFIFILLHYAGHPLPQAAYP